MLFSSAKRSGKMFLRKPARKSIENYFNTTLSLFYFLKPISTFFWRLLTAFDWIWHHLTPFEWKWRFSWLLEGFCSIFVRYLFERASEKGGVFRTNVEWIWKKTRKNYFDSQAELRKWINHKKILSFW